MHPYNMTCLSCRRYLHIHRQHLDRLPLLVDAGAVYDDVPVLWHRLVHHAQNHQRVCQVGRGRRTNQFLGSLHFLSGDTSALACLPVMAYCLECLRCMSGHGCHRSDATGPYQVISRNSCLMFNTARRGLHLPRRLKKAAAFESQRQPCCEE
jgi:hypothetical protein